MTYDTPEGPEDFTDDADHESYEEMCFKMDVYPYCHCCTCCGHSCYDEDDEPAY